MSEETKNLLEDGEQPQVFRPRNKIKDKVTQGGQIVGSGFDPDLLKKAEGRAQNMMGDFLEAADSDIERLVATCGDAVKDVENRSAHLAKLENIAHEIKGYGTNINYDLLTQFSNSLSLFLRKADVDDSIKMEVARTHVDAIRLVFFSQLTGDGGETGAKLSEALNQTLVKFVDEF